jgi:hypothetical protein
VSEDDDIKEARRKGIEDGKLLSDVENHGMRLGRLEKGILGLIGAIVAAWAKSKDLW